MSALSSALKKEWVTRGTAGGDVKVRRRRVMAADIAHWRAGGVVIFWTHHHDNSIERE